MREIKLQGLRRGSADDAHARFAKANLCSHSRWSLRLGRVQAKCRVSAEIDVKRVDPKWWLAQMHRVQPGAPGWSENSLQQPEHSRGLSINVHLEDETKIDG